MTTRTDATVAECPLCYLNRRGKLSIPYSRRWDRIESSVEEKCATCPRRTIWRTGPLLPVVGQE